jgi:hypothetical protein
VFNSRKAGSSVLTLEFRADFPVLSLHETSPCVPSRPRCT